MRSSAEISPCGTYRHQLARTWVMPGDPLADVYATWIMLNPSTADAEHNDPTIRRCISYSKAIGMGGLVVVNLFDLRATDPYVLYDHPKPCSESNDQQIVDACGQAKIVIAAWGAHPAADSRSAHVCSLVSDLHVLKLTKYGAPAHPLYLSFKACVRPVPWRKDAF